jgi:PAS domain S-box-containing protein
MVSKGDRRKGTARLRRRAEQIAREQGGQAREAPPTPSHEEALKLVYELRVHQIELRMQNEELSRAQAELSATHQRYFDLYNLAPVGYFIVSHEGRILEANLTGVGLLGVPQVALVKQPITRFIATEDQDIYYQHRRQLLAKGKARPCELRMVKGDGTTFWARLAATPQDGSAIARMGAGSAPATRIVLSDISEQKQSEQDKAELHARLEQEQKRRRVGARPAKGKRPAGPRASR